MKNITLTFPDDDSTAECIIALASRWNITPEQLVKRAVAEFLGKYSPPKELPPDVEPPTNLRDFFKAHGL